MQRFAEEMSEVLAAKWRVVRQLTQNESVRLFEDFVAECIRLDMTRVFHRSYSGHKPVTKRVFRNCRILAQDSALSDVLGLAPKGEIRARVLFGRLEKCAAFEVLGRPTSADHLFVTDEDSIGEVTQSGRRLFLFLDAQRGTLYRAS